jgi:hypothetical protein
VSYVMRQGRRIEVVPLDTGQRPKRRRKTFEAQFVQIPKSWIMALSKARSSGAAWQLATVILDEAFKREYIGGEIVLSAHVTGMPQSTRRDATKELISLGLIQLEPGVQGKSAPRVSIVQKLKARKSAYRVLLLLFSLFS